MTNVLFNKETLNSTGHSRQKLPFESEVLNVDIANLTKQHSYTNVVGKLDEENNVLYLLPQESIIEVVNNDVKVETTEVTEEPVLVKVLNKIPLLDKDGKQIQYELTSVLVTPPVLDEDGEVLEPETTEIVGTGIFNKCYTSEEVEVQKVDEDEKPLFYKVESVPSDVLVEQPPIEITSDNELYVEGLEKATAEVEAFKTITFEDDPSLFHYDDIVSFKEKQCKYGTFYVDAVLFESMDGVFDNELANYNADLGFDFISIPSGGQARTVKLLLPAASKYVGIKTEVNVGGLTISIGNLASDLRPLDKKNEVQFATSITEVYVLFKNTTDKRIDLHSFVLLV